jgi:hypothetical protein
MDQFHQRLLRRGKPSCRIANDNGVTSGVLLLEHPERAELFRWSAVCQRKSSVSAYPMLITTPPSICPSSATWLTVVPTTCGGV